MKAWRGTKPGLENTHINEKEPIPQLTGDHDILIKVLAVGLNPVDYKRASWPTAKYPFTLGLDTCGVVSKTGAKVDTGKFVEGKTIVLLHGSLANEHGYFAEYAIHDSRYLSIVPEQLYQGKDLAKVVAELAALPCASFTAYQIICNKLKIPLTSQQNSSYVKVVKNIVVSAGAGGVGGFCLQLLKIWRDNLPQDVRETVKIITTCSGKNGEHVKKLGATHVIDYNQEDVVKRSLELSDNEGVDIFIDNVGSENRKMGADSLTFGGELVVVVESGDNIPLDTFWAKAQSVHCVMLGGAYGTKQHDRMVEIKLIGDQILELYASGKIESLLDEVIPFEKIQEALYRLQDRHVKGKIVAQVANGI